FNHWNTVEITFSVSLWPDLTTYRCKLNMRVILLGCFGIDKSLKAFAYFWIFNRGAPFIPISANHMLHTAFQFSRNAKRIVHNDIFQIIQPTFHIVTPYTGALQTIRRLDIEHKEAVDIFDECGSIQIRGEQFSMARFHTAIAAY